MKELIIMMGALLPKEEIIDNISQEIEKYKAGKSEGTQGIEMYCMLLLTKAGASTCEGETDGDKAINMIKKMDKFDTANKIFDQDKYHM